MSNSLSGTLWVLPPVLAALWLMGRWARDRGAASIPAAIRALQGIALTVLVVLALGSGHLGLSAGTEPVEPLLMTGFTLWLAVRALQLVRALAAVTRGLEERRPPWPFFVLPLALYLAVAPWMTAQRGLDGDEPHYLLIAHSLAYDFDTDLTNNYSAQDSLRFSDRILAPEWADPVRADGRRYSRHSPLLPALLAPGYRALGKWGALSTMMVIAALVAWSSLSLAWKRLDGEGRAAAVQVWALLGLTPPVLLYSHQVWTELPAALLMLLALHRIRSLGAGAVTTRRHWLVLAAALVLLPVLKLRFAVLSISLLALAWWRSGRSRRLLLGMGILLTLVLGSILLYNQLAFDNPFKDHTFDQLLQIQSRSPLDYLRGTAGLLWDCAFGLFACNPLWMLLIPAVVLVARRRSTLLLDLAVCSLPYLALVAPRLEWYGAWSPPFRFGMVLLPLFSLALLPLARSERAAGARGLVAGLGLLALALCLLWVAVPGWTYNLATGTNHLSDHLSLRWTADVGRFFPSMVRFRFATVWVPIVATLLVVLSWWYPEGRSRSAGTWAAVLVLLALAGLPVAASRWPTRIVEFEDRQVEKQGGELYPEPWTHVRPRFRGGWVLDTGEALRAPVVAGGPSCTVEVELQPRVRSAEWLHLRLLSGSEELGSWMLGEDHDWQTLTLEDVSWPPGEDLTLRLEGGKEAVDSGMIIVDRARFLWP